MTSQIMRGENYIDGRWQAGGGPAWQRCSPADGKVVWEGNWATVSQVGQAVAAARQAFPVWAERRLDDRIAICRQFAEGVRERKDRLAELIAIEVGKPLWEARTEVAAVIAKVESSVDALLKRRWTTTEEIGDYLAVTRYRPHGVMFVIGPFNFPAHIPGGHIIPALLAGNTVVFKASEHGPATGQWLVEQWERVGLPPGVINLVHGAAEVAEAGVQSNEVDGVLFTGSHRVGTILHRSLAGKPEKVLALEMGGNNPLVLHDTRDIHGAAITAILSAYLSSGQRCTCARRLIISGRDLFEQVLDELGRLIPQVMVGLPMDEDQPFMGPLIHADAAAGMLAAEQGLLSAGAQAIVSMQASDRSPALVTPALLVVEESSIIEDCEHFGPMLIATRADSLDHAIALANASRFGLSAGFLGDRVEDFHYFIHRIRAGVVNWNRQTTGASGKLPFGGVGASGNHHPSGYFAADYCSYPIASLESHELTESKKALPGLKFYVD
jgi:succinylglutamic semialdehyde dehydrogenase